MPKATAHRIVAELVKEGMLERGESGLRLGVALYMLGTRVPRQVDLRDTARPFVERLHHLTLGGAFVFISDVLHQDAGLVDSVHHSSDSGESFREQVVISTRAATEVLRLNGAGRALPVSHRRPVGEVSVRTAGRGSGEVLCVLRNRVVILRTPGTVALAAPLLLSPGTAVGVLAVAAPPGRVHETETASHLQAAGAAVSRALQRNPDLLPQP